MKYTREQLSTMARKLVRLRVANDRRYEEFLMIMSIRTGHPTDYIERRIIGFAADTAGARS